MYSKSKKWSFEVEAVCIISTWNRFQNILGPDLAHWRHLRRRGKGWVLQTDNYSDLKTLYVNSDRSLRVSTEIRNCVQVYKTIANITNSVVNDKLHPLDINWRGTRRKKKGKRNRNLEAIRWSGKNNIFEPNRNSARCRMMSRFLLSRFQHTL